MPKQLPQATRARIANNKLAIRAHLHVEREVVPTDNDPFAPDFQRQEGDISYGLTNTQYWDVTKQQWLPLSPDNPDKFIIIGRDYETTRAEFWARWKIFCAQRFNQTFIPIEWIQ